MINNRASKSKMSLEDVTDSEIMQLENAKRGMTDHRLFSLLNLSHASFNVANTLAEIIRCSVVALVGI